MSRFAQTYEDPEYEYQPPEGELAEMITEFNEWHPDAQQRLIDDLTDVTLEDVIRAWVTGVPAVAEKPQTTGYYIGLDNPA